MSPPNNSTFSYGEPITLSWNPPLDWGGDCPNVNRTLGLKLSNNPNSMGGNVQVWQAPYTTSTLVVGSNIEISGIGFTTLNKTMRVVIQYPSLNGLTGNSLITGTPKLSAAIDAQHVGICIPMSGKSGWNANAKTRGINPQARKQGPVNSAFHGQFSPSHHTV